MPSKASLPSSLVDPVDNLPPQSLDSVERHSKQSSSRSKLSSNSSNNNENPILKSFKNFRRKSDDPKVAADQQNNTEKVNSILYRRPSFVLTSSMNDIDNGDIVHEGNKSLKPPDAINLTPPSPAPSTTSFLKAPGFLKVPFSICSCN